MNISAIILAGGNSSRMKYNKEFIKIGEEYLVHIQIKTLQTIFKEVIVVTNNFEHYDDFDVTLVKDILTGKSPIIGLHAGLMHSKTEYNYCIACDMPYINLEFINYMISLLNNHEAYVAKYNNFIEPFNAFYSKNIVTKIEDFIALENYGFQRLVKTLKTEYISEQKVNYFLQQNDMFKNINEESDLLDDNLSITSNYQKMEVEKVISGESFKIIDKVITEYPLSLFINDVHYSTMVLTPEDIEFLVLGYLHSEFVIKTLDEVLDFKLNLEDHRCDVTISHEVNTNNSQRLDIMSTACGNAKLVRMEDTDLPVVKNNNRFNLSTIYDEVAIFNKESILFKETGGVHSVELLYDNNKVLFEDIGRHNAVDKVVGYILKNQIKTDNLFIITSGRISSDILLKAALMNIGLVVSRSAPTTLAIKLAIKLGVTVVGFARGNKLNIYTHQNRIVKE